jgi:DNA polymerase-3 subunit alpha (Gram-positive type)
MTRGQDKVKNTLRELDQRGNELSQKEKNVYTILEVVNEMYARGISFLPVDLYESDAAKFKMTDKGIRPPLNALQGLGASAAQNIVEARKQDGFLSIEDLQARAKTTKTVVDILKSHGCLDGMPESSQISFFNL